MKNITDKIQAGVLNLSTVPLYRLKQWANETTNQRDKDALGCEIIYR